VKRSRHSKYDKKRTRSRKDSKRKFTYGTKQQTKNSIDRLHDFQITENQEKKYNRRQIQPRKGNAFSIVKWPIIIIVLIFIVRLVLSFDGFQNSHSTPLKNDSIIQEAVRKDAQKHLPEVNVRDFIVGKNRRLRQVIQLKKDSTFPIVPYVNLRLFKAFRMYDTAAFPTTPIFAKYSKYYFFYNRVKKYSKQSLTNQWATLRNELTRKVFGSSFTFNDQKNYVYKGMIIKEKEFTILSNNTELHGVATLLEFEGMRYFFHFISKEKEGKRLNTRFLKKNIDYYLKIK
jgi:hypothetical protein